MIKIPEYKKYKIEIDPEILEDLNKLRERKAMPIWFFIDELDLLIK